MKNVLVESNCSRKLSPAMLCQKPRWGAEEMCTIIHLIEFLGCYDSDRYYIQNLFYQLFITFRECSTPSTLFTSINKQYTSCREAKMSHGDNEA